MAMTNGYRRALTATLHARWIIVAVWARRSAALGAVFFMAAQVGARAARRIAASFSVWSPRRRVRRRSTPPIS